MGTFMSFILGLISSVVAMFAGAIVILIIFIEVFRVRKQAAMYVVFEGIDGSGKETQSKLLEQYAKSNGLKVLRISYPEYGKWHCKLVEMYLHGRFGKNAMKLNPLVISLFYAVDRFFSMYIHSKNFDKNTIVVFDRYVTSNMLFQLAKIDSQRERVLTRRRLEKLEYGLFKLPMPNIVFLMDIPVDFSLEILKSRGDAKHGAATDIHEDCAEIMKKAASVAYEMAAQCSWKIIPVTVTESFTSNISYRKPGEIHEDVLKHFTKEMKIWTMEKDKSNTQVRV